MQEEMIVYGIIFLVALAAVFICLRDDKDKPKRTIYPGIGHGCISKTAPELIPPKRKGGYQPKEKSGPGDPPKGGSSVQATKEKQDCTSCLLVHVCGGRIRPECTYKNEFWGRKYKGVTIKVESEDPGKAYNALEQFFLERGVPVARKGNDKMQTAEEKMKMSELVINTDKLLDQAKLDPMEIYEIMNRLEEMNFFTAPASTTFHGAYMGGLAEHSLNVARTLAELAEKAGIKWQNERSPYIIGLFHDLCKCDQYVLKETGQGYEYRNKKLLEGHGAKSAMLAGTLLQLTEEEMLCIRYHMGSYQKEDWTGYDLAIKKYPAVLFTHTADMIASKLQEG